MAKKVMTELEMREHQLEKLEKKAQRKLDEAVKLLGSLDSEYAELVEAMKHSTLGELEQALKECKDEDRQDFLDFSKGVIDELIRRERGGIDLNKDINTIRCSHRRAYQEVRCPSCEEPLKWNPSFEETRWCWTACCGLHFEMTVECVKVEIRRLRRRDSEKPYVPSAKFTFVFGKKEETP